MENKIKTKIVIGAPTYNDFRRINNLLTSIVTFTPQDELNECKIVIVDDGTPDEDMKSGLREVCKNFNVPLVEHDKNYGIPKAWNTLTNFYNAEIIVLLNDDIQICEASWLKCMIYFLENNDKIGGVGWPIIHMDPRTGTSSSNMFLPNLDGKPALVGAAIGCSFAFKKIVYDQIKDGFWELLTSFYEESVSGERFTIIKNENGLIELINFQELFCRYEKNKKIYDSKEIIEAKGIQVLTGQINESIQFKRDFLFSDWEKEIFDLIVSNPEKILRFGLIDFLFLSYPNKNRDNLSLTLSRLRKKIDSKSKIFEGVWKPLKKIIRKESSKALINIAQKYGETEVTADHSIMSIIDGKIVPLTAKEVFERNQPFLQVMTIPKSEKEITQIDLKNFISFDKRIKIGENEIIYTVQDKRKMKISRFITEDNLAKWCKLIGWYVSEGSISQVGKNFGIVFFSNNNQSLLQEAFFLAKNIFGSCRMENFQVLSGYDLPANIFKNMCGQYSKNKCLPNFVFNIPDKYKEILWQSLLDGDGFSFQNPNVKQDLRYSEKYRKEFFGYCTVSFKLVNQLFLLTRQLGKRCVLTERTFKKKEWNKAYELRLSKQYHNSKLKTKMKKNPTLTTRYVYDLELEDNHMFVDSCGLILLHNTDVGFEMAKMGFASYMLPAPCLEHWGSRTFSENPELSICRPNEFLPMEEYKEIMLKRYPLQQIEPLPGFVFRMNYSRCLFAKKWGCDDFWDSPQQKVHETFVYPLIGRKIKWLDKNLIEREEELK